MEMTIEEKAKAYDEALKVLHKYDGVNILFSQSLKEEMFPELAESRDERVKKAIITLLNTTVKGKKICSIADTTRSEMLAWLEKQGEHAKFRDSIQVGDKVTRNEDGVLVNLSQLNRVAKKDEKQGEKKPILDVEIPFGAKDSELEEVSYDIPKGYHAEIEDNKVVIKKGEKNPAEWSDKDENLFRCAIDAVKIRVKRVRAEVCLDEEVGEMVINWLKSLKDRIQLQPKQQWGEEDERIKNNLLSELTNLSARKLIEKETEKKYASWLKSLRPQSSWKPSKEQMKALNTCIMQGEISYLGIQSLYNDLKKLSEE